MEAIGESAPLQLSDPVALPRAASMIAVDGLQPSVVVAVEVGVITGAVISKLQVTVRDIEPVLPQASVAVHVRV